MKTRSILLKSIALLLVLVTVFSMLISCTIGKENGGESSDLAGDSDAFLDDDIPGDDNSGNNAGNVPPSADGSLVIFANGEYTASVIRHEMADAFDKTMYADIRALFKKKVSKNLLLSLEW